jgi:glutamyl-tRNA synthetase
MLDFQSGIDDHLTGVTHIIRGIDLQDSAKRQGFLYDYFGWEYPEVVHWGHVQIEGYDVAMSTSTIGEKIDAGELDGWDDPRAPTVASLRKRGIRGEAIVNAMIQLGMSTSNVDLALSSIYAENRELIDDETDRAFMVRDDPEHGGGAVEKQVIGGPETADPPVHPDYEDRGRRSIPVGSAILIESADVPQRGERVWLKGLGCVRHTRDAFQYTGDDLAVTRDEDVDFAHWAPADTNVSLQLRTMDGDMEGVAEPGVREYDVGDLLQFERVGFARLDDVPADGAVVAYFTHP